MIVDSAAFADMARPRRLLHRGSEIEQLLRSLEPALRGESGNAMIAGPSGVGKTSLARYGVHQLQNQAPEIERAYVRCLGQDSAGILQDVLSAHPAVRDRAIADEEDPDTLQASLRSAVEMPFVVILDEAGDLPQTNALQLVADCALVSPVVVCHDAGAFRARIPREYRHLVDGGRCIELDRYSVAELTDILEARARAGLPPGAWSRAQLETIADRAAGVAREAIQALGAAAEHADEQGRGSITAADIEAGIDRARKEIRVANLRSLTIQYELCYAIVHESGRLSGQAFHERYDSVAPTVLADYHAVPLSRRARRNKLDKLVAYDLIERAGKGKGTEYAVVDAAITPQLTVTAVADT